MNDVKSFAVAFLIVWGGLAAYLVWLHRVTARMEARMESSLSSSSRARPP